LGSLSLRSVSPFLWHVFVNVSLPGVLVIPPSQELFFVSFVRLSALKYFSLLACNVHVPLQVIKQNLLNILLLLTSLISTHLWTTTRLCLSWETSRWSRSWECTEELPLPDTESCDSVGSVAAPPALEQQSVRVVSGMLVDLIFLPQLCFLADEWCRIHSSVVYLCCPLLQRKRQRFLCVPFPFVVLAERLKHTF
jgi:hypothetical protein